MLALRSVLLRVALQHMSTWMEVLLDSTVLVLSLLPALYIFVVRPLERQISIRFKVETELLEIRVGLEQRVVERTAELERRNQQTMLYGQMGEMLHSCNTKDEACRVVAKIASQIFPGVSGALYVYSPSHNDLDQLTSWGELKNMQSALQPNECWALRRGRAHREERSKSEILCLSCHDKIDVNTICLPMAGQGETIGVLQLSAEQTQESGFEQLDNQLASAMAEQIALTFANIDLRETLRRQAIRDPLTNLFNRRYLEETLTRELSRAQRKGVTLSLFMLDVDHFKSFNDTHGHDAGDAVLQELGAYLQRQIRADDIACRYGGEEFTIILPEANQQIGYERAEQLRKGLQNLDVWHRGNLLGKITISVGVAIYPANAITGEALLKVADRALYRAKNEGRNRVVVAE